MSQLFASEISYYLTALGIDSYNNKMLSVVLLHNYLIEDGGFHFETPGTFRIVEHNKYALLALVLCGLKFFAQIAKTLVKKILTRITRVIRGL